MRLSLLCAALLCVAGAAEAEPAVTLDAEQKAASELVDKVTERTQRLESLRKRYSEDGDFPRYAAERAELYAQLDLLIADLRGSRKRLIQIRESQALLDLMSFAGKLAAKNRRSAVQAAPQLLGNIQFGPVERDAERCLERADRAVRQERAAFAAEEQRIRRQRIAFGALAAAAALAGLAVLLLLRRKRRP